MSKPNIHPEYHEITLVAINGEQIKTKSTFGKPGQIVKLEIDPSSHPAWREEGDANIIMETSSVAKFNARFKRATGDK